MLVLGYDDYVKYVEYFEFDLQFLLEILAVDLSQHTLTRLTCLRT